MPLTVTKLDSHNQFLLLKFIFNKFKLSKRRSKAAVCDCTCKQRSPYSSVNKIMIIQRAKKVLFDSPGLVDFV